MARRPTRAARGAGERVMEVAFEYLAEDYLLWSEDWARTSSQGIETMRKGRVLLVSIALVLGLVAALAFDHLVFRLTGALVALAVGVVWWFTYPATFLRSSRRSAESVVRDSPATIFGPRRYVFDERGFRFSGPHAGGYVMWEAVDRIDVAANGLYLYIAANTAHVVPRRALSDAREFEELANRVSAWRRAVGAAPGPATTDGR